MNQPPDLIRSLFHEFYSISIFYAYNGLEFYEKVYVESA